MNHSETSVRQVKENDDGSFICVGFGRNILDGKLEGFFMKMNSNGIKQWSRRYRHATGAIANNYLHDVIQTPDGGWAAVGYRNDTGVSDQDVWVIKVDSMGCLEPGCHLIDGIETIVDGLQHSMQVFPNPVQDLLNIRWDLPLDFQPSNFPNQQLVIIDMTGREVYRESINGISNGFGHSIDLSSLASGMYTLHWVSDSKWLDSVKLVKE